MNWLLFWTAVAAVAAGLSAVGAAFYTALTYRLVKSQGEPRVVVYVRHDDSRPTMIEIVVRNIGQGVANCIRFSYQGTLPTRAYGVALTDAKPAEEMTDGPLVDGIPALGPGDSRRITWGQFGGLFNALGTKSIPVTCHFKHGAREMTPTIGQLEVRSFVGTHVTRSDSAAIADALRDITKALNSPNRVAGSFGGARHYPEDHGE